MNKLLQFIEHVRRINEQYCLTRHEIALLELSTKRYLSNESTTVGVLIRQTYIASQATLHMALKNLIAKKLLATKPSKLDGRIKLVIPTKLTLDLYKQLNCVVSSPL